MGRLDVDGLEALMNGSGQFLRNPVSSTAFFNSLTKYLHLLAHLVRCTIFT